MKIIELLTKIANEEEVPLIKYRDKILHWNKEKDRFEDKDGMNTLYEMDFSELNDEVEKIEDKKIRKIKVDYSPDIEEKIFYEDGDKPRHCVLGDAGTELLINKINEIIDYINGGINGE